MAGEQYEFAVLKEVREKIDSKAEHRGGSSCTEPDILLSNGKIIEVKGPLAQYGQFVNSTIDKNIYGRAIIKAFEDKYGETLKNNDIIEGDLCNKWILYYYKNIKKIHQFGYVHKDATIEFSDPEDFINNHKFKCTYRAKGSGSRAASKWVDKVVPTEWECIRKNGKLFAQNTKAIKETIIRKNSKGVSTRIYINDSGEVRILSNTKNPTYIFSMDPRSVK